MVHIRYAQDYYDSLPFFKWLRIFLPEEKYIKLLQKLPPFLIDRFNSKQGIKGMMITTPLMPDMLMSSRKGTEIEILRIKRLLDRMCVPLHNKIVIGLGAWWPMVSKKGELFLELLASDKYRVTTGHSATSYSIIRTAEYLIKEAEIKHKKCRVIIFGCGNIGKNVALALAQKNINLILVDIHARKLEHFKSTLHKKYKKIEIDTELFEKSKIKELLDRSDFGICATSNLRAIIDKEDIPENFVFIDDSRPEAIPRFGNHEKKYTLEGGLLHIKGFVSRYNVGFGNDNNILGCLAEAFILAWDGRNGSTLKETIGKVTNERLQDLDKFCKTHDIRYGDFKMGKINLAEKLVINAVSSKHYKENLRTKKIIKSKEFKNFSLPIVYTFKKSSTELTPNSI